MSRRDLRENVVMEWRSTRHFPAPRRPVVLMRRRRSFLQRLRDLFA